MNLDWIPEAQLVLQHLTGSAVRPYFTLDFGNAVDEQGMSAVVTASGAKEFLQNVRGQLPPGLVAFIGTAVKWDQDETQKMVEIVVAPGESQYDILRLAQSAASNYGLDTEDLIHHLWAFDQAYGIDIFHAEMDVVEFALLTLPPDLSGFAHEIYAFCPDIVEQGLGSLMALEEYIEDNRRVYLWWA